MARLPDLRRINKEDFQKDDQDMADKLAFPLNSFMEQTRAAFDHAIDFSNLNQELIVLTVTVDDAGVPVQRTQYKSNLQSNVAGTICINSVNQTTLGNYPLATPFLSVTQNANIVTVLNIRGLTPNERYQLTILSIGK